MVTLKIDEVTFAVWTKQSLSLGLSVEDWLKIATADTATDIEQGHGLSLKERMLRFDALTQTMEQMRLGSGGFLDDSRESIYGERLQKCL